MRHVVVFEGRQRDDERIERLQRRDGHLDVDDRLGRETGDSRRPVMFDAMGKVSESMGQTRFLSDELGWPLGVVRQEGDPIHR